MSDVINNNNHDHNHNHSHTHEHDHSHASNHSHMHVHTNTKVVLNRLAKATGHLQSVKRMVENGKDCSEVLIQLSAVIAALNNVGKVILEDHIDHCIVDAVKSGDHESIDNLKNAINRFIK